MQRVWQSIVARYLIALLIIALFPGAALAQDKPGISLEQAIHQVKDNFDIPKEFTNFTSSYNTCDNLSRWSLNWNASGEPGGSFRAEVDASTGEIISMRVWKYEQPPEPGIQLPVLSAAEARQIASKLVERLAPQRVPELRLLPDDNQLIPLERYERVNYTVRWQRIVNEVAVPGDGITVEVRGDNGQVVSYNLSWTQADFPAASGAISPDKARQVFADNNILELQYFLPDGRVKAETGKKKQPILVYQLHHPSNGAIDALRGEPLKLEEGQWFRDADGYGGMGSREMEMAQKAMPSQAAPTPLSPEELKEIKKTAKLISQDDAITTVNKWVDIPENLTLRSANLMAAWRSPETRIWNLHWNADKTEPGKMRYVSARVNAATRELMGFEQYYEPADPRKTGSMDRKAAKKMAEAFLQQVQLQRFQEVKLDESYNPGWDMVPLKEGENPRIQRFNYRRVVNGVVFPANGINVTVDTVVNRITQYNLDWIELDFPTPQGILNFQQAVKAFLEERPLTLAYIQVYGPGSPGEKRLVYQPMVKPGRQFFNMLDARTGEPLDWQGKPLAQQPRAYHFTDITGNFAEKEISLLGRAGIFGEYGDAFHPNEKVTMVSLLRAMLMANESIWGKMDMTDQEILKRSKERRWLQEDVSSGDTVSREMLARLMVRMLNLERAARAEGIYKVPYADGKSLSAGAIGYVALTWGLGILRGDGYNFEPNHNATRAEAAAVLVRALANKS